MITYGESTLPGDVITVEEIESTAVSRGFDASVALVGGYDASNGSIAADKVGTAVQVRGSAEAADKFGHGSELHRATQLAEANGAGTVHCVPVPETSVTGEDPSSGTAGELGHAPIFDPNVQPEHDITDQGGNDIHVSYDVESETVSGTEGYVDPTTGEFKGDSGTTYSLDYDYGDYTNGAIRAATRTDARIVVVLTEDDGHASVLDSRVQDAATNFEFKHGVIGAGPEVADPSTYEDSHESPWLVVVPHSRGYFDNTEQPEVRTTAAVGGAFAGSDLTDSTTSTPLELLASLRTEHTAGEIATFGDAEYETDDNDIEGVTPLIARDSIEIVEDLTTDPDGDFRSLYKHEIVNDITYNVHLVAHDFTSEPNTTESREQELLVPIENLLRSASNQSPPMLYSHDSDRPYAIDVGVGGADDVATLTVGLDPLDVAKRIEVNINVGDVITFEGASS